LQSSSAGFSLVEQGRNGHKCALSCKYSKADADSFYPSAKTVRTDPRLREELQILPVSAGDFIFGRRPASP
jgi:hypothetical protein